MWPTSPLKRRRRIQILGDRHKREVWPQELGNARWRTIRTTGCGPRRWRCWPGPSACIASCSSRRGPGASAAGQPGSRRWTCWRPRRRCWCWPPCPASSEGEIEAAIDGAFLVIAGERDLPRELRTAVIHRLELPQGRFERRVPLPPGRYDKIAAPTRTAAWSSACPRCADMTPEDDARRQRSASAAEGVQAAAPTAGRRPPQAEAARRSRRAAPPRRPPTPMIVVPVRSMVLFPRSCSR